MFKVLITTVPFGEIDRLPLDLLEKSNIDYVINPLNKKLSEDQLVELITDFDAVIAGTEEITEKVMTTASNLKLISRVGIGLDSVDLLAAERLKIGVSYTPDAPAPAVADLTIGLMYSLLRKTHQANIHMHNGNWHRFFGKRLVDCTIGVIGAGRVGTRVIESLKALGCKKIMYYDKNVRIQENQDLVFAQKEEIYAISDIISFHIPLDPETKNMVTWADMKRMKKDVSLINTSRGGIINEQDLSDALRDNVSGGAAIDVFTQEPYQGILSEHDNCILTSHMGSMTVDCRSRMEIEATEEVVRFVAGEALQSRVPAEEYDIRRL
jgi:D-3-phosphoglycerate dehydrogenase